MFLLAGSVLVHRTVDMRPFSYFPLAFVALGLRSVPVLPTYQMVFLLPVVRLIPSTPLLGVVGGSESGARGPRKLCMVTALVARVCRLVSWIRCMF